MFSAKVEHLLRLDDTEEEELREEIEDDVDECDLDPNDPFCVALELQ